MAADISPPIYLMPVIVDNQQRAREAVKRRKPFNYKSVTQPEVQQAESEGWILDRELTKKVRLKRAKLIDERLENRFWMLLFKLGYPEMNQGRSFSILLERKGAQALRKQIDVFAKDDETVLIAECKASEKVVKRSLQKDVEEFAKLKGPIAQSVQRHYGREFKPKIIWFLVTENVLWSKPDKERAAGENIRIVTERELRYYTQIAEHLGKAARYQFLAEFLKDQEIPELRGKTVPAIRGKLGGKRFYSFVMRPRDLLKISFVNHRSLNDPEGAPTYQRLVSKTRMRDIGKFIKSGGFFPTNLLINFVRNVRFEQTARDDVADVAFGRLYLPDKYRSAWIIDGQHRLYGFSPIDDAFLDSNVIVVAFEKLGKTEEAQLFVTINHEQRSVPKHLLDDLEGELKWGSSVPLERIGAIASRLISVLNTDAGCPFYNRIPQQGIPSTSKTCLTIPALKDALRRSGLLGNAILNSTSYELGPLCGSSDGDTLERARCALTTYFERVRDANMSQWEKGRAGLLCTNVGVQAYIILLSALIKYWEVNSASDAKELEAEEIVAELEEYLEPILEFLNKSNDEAMKTAFTVPFGSGGPPEYYFRLCNVVKARFADFEPEGMIAWNAGRSEESVSAADRQIKEIYTATQKHIFDVLKTVFGAADDAYWQKGVTDKAMKAEAYRKSLDDEQWTTTGNLFGLHRFQKNRREQAELAVLQKRFQHPRAGGKGLCKKSQVDR